jgi:hypothetical protein
MDETNLPPPPASRFQFRLATLFIATFVAAVALAILLWNPLAGYAFAAVSASVLTIHLSRTHWNASVGRATWHGVISGAVFFGVPFVGSVAVTTLYFWAKDGFRGGLSDGLFIILAILLVAGIAAFLAGLTIGLTALFAYQVLKAIREVYDLIIKCAWTTKPVEPDDSPHEG